MVDAPMTSLAQDIFEMPENTRRQDADFTCFRGDPGSKRFASRLLKRGFCFSHVTKGRRPLTRNKSLISETRLRGIFI